MKKRASTILSMASLVFLLGTAAASAGSIELRADIPFDFMAGNKMLPAGTYTASHPDELHAMLLLRNQNSNRGAVIVRTNGLEAVKTSEDTKLIFKRYGDRYFLHQIWTTGRRDGYVVLKSSQEREFAKEVAAKGGPGPEIVTVVATVE